MKLNRLLKRKVKKPKPTTASVEADKRNNAKVSKSVGAYLRVLGASVSAQVKKKYRLKKSLRSILKAVDPTDPNKIADELDLSESKAFFTDDFAAYLESIHAEASTAAIEALQLEEDVVSIDQIDQMAADYAEARAAELVTMIDDTTRESIRSLIADAIENGLTSQELGESIMDSHAFSAVRADRIARTEIVKAHVEGNSDGWKKSGMVIGTQWITAQDEITCDECGGNDGERRAFDEEFSDGSTAPPAHPNCRCDVLAILDDETIDDEEPDDEAEKVDLAVILKK